MDTFAKNLSGKIILIMDQAGWHKNLNVPSNIEIIFLPPYSPELNPVERLWKHIKDGILKNRVYSTLDILENHLIEYLKSLPSDTIKSVCKCSYI